jgi:hypothetical protein
VRLYLEGLPSGVRWMLWANVCVSYHGIYLSKMGVQVTACLTLLKGIQVFGERMEASYRIVQLVDILLWAARLTIISQPIRAGF